jgi:hypothetical protein
MRLCEFAICRKGSNREADGWMEIRIWHTGDSKQSLCQLLLTPSGGDFWGLCGEGRADAKRAGIQAAARRLVPVSPISGD